MSNDGISLVILGINSKTLEGVDPPVEVFIINDSFDLLTKRWCCWLIEIGRTVLKFVCIVDNDCNNERMGSKLSWILNVYKLYRIKTWTQRLI